MAGLISKGIIFGLGVAAGKAIYNPDTIQKNKERIVNGVSKLLLAADMSEYVHMKDRRRRYGTPYYDRVNVHRYYSSYTGTAAAKNHKYWSRKHAESVLNCMRKAIADYGVASVVDLKDALKKYEGLSYDILYRDRDFVWTDLSTASILPCTGGYIIKWPFEEDVEVADGDIEGEDDEE